MERSAKSKMIAFRANQGECKALEVMSFRERRTISDMLRVCIREAADRRQLAEMGLIDLIPTRPEGVNHG